MEELIKLEDDLKEHIVFVYNNFDSKYHSIIDNDLVNQIYLSLKELNKYNRLNIVLNTTGGNLAAGTRLIDILNRMYDSFEFTILNRCHSTGTYIALSSSKINISPNALITPCEPQMEVNGESVSTSLIRNIIENPNNMDNICSLLDPVIYGRYYSTINYFKDLCNRVYKKEQALLIIDYMLNKVNSHQYPLSLKELSNLGIIVNLLEGDLLTTYESIEKKLYSLFNTEKIDDEKEYRISLVSDRYNDKIYVKRYKYSNNEKIRVYDGYKVLDRR